MKNKKAAEMTIGTIIIIILALVVLAVIIYGFTTGWGNLWENIRNFGGGKINVGSIVNACQVACASSSVYDYCTLPRKVIFDDQGKNNPDNVNLWTCNKLALTKTELGMSCAAVICPETSTITTPTATP
ncbi:MAG: hypothetical protein PHF67_03195 [Candidatus Nanoarchaeia archaeon]|nr:hypothetical protein [Candidatus Nanoarchaeia archaeon]